MNYATSVKKEANKKLDILERQEETPEGDIKTCIYNTKGA